MTHGSPEDGSPEVICPLCGASGRTVALDLGHWRVVRCSVCALLYTDPRPDEIATEDLYSDGFYDVAYPGPLGVVRDWMHRLVMRERSASLGGKATGRLLDVGCGDGDFVAYMSRRGWEARGCDTSRAAVKRAADRAVNADCGTVASLGYPAASFDVVTMWHVLEHLREPVPQLREIAHILKPDGILAIEVPNAGSPLFRICGAQWFPLDVPRHLLHLTRSSLHQLLFRSGFEAVRFRGSHVADAALVALSTLSKSGLYDSATDRYCTRALGHRGFLGKTVYMGAIATAAAVSIPYTAVASLVMREGESITVTARLA